jgi:hypothetical protein
VTTPRRERQGVHKEIIALSLLLASAGINLVLTRNLELLLPPAIALLLFLFIMSRTRLLPLVGAYPVGMAIFLYTRKAGIHGDSLELSMMERYLLCSAQPSSSGCLLRRLRSSGELLLDLGLFGLLYASIDILLSIDSRSKDCFCISLFRPL